MSVRFDAPSQHLGRPVHERGTVVVVSNLILPNSRLHSRVWGTPAKRAQDRKAAEHKTVVSELWLAYTVLPTTDERSQSYSYTP